MWIRIDLTPWIRIQIRIDLGFLDPDPTWFGFPGSGSVLGIRIRIQES